MRKKQVAVLDVGSSKITAVLGERGINNTFLIKARKDFVYDGFSEREFLDAETLGKVVASCARYLKNAAGENADTVYVGVPGAFTDVTVKDSQISFSKKKKISEKDLDDLFDSAFVLPSAKKALINRSSIVFELDGYRRLANPIGETSETLKGKLSFIFCDDYFIRAFKPPIIGAGFSSVEFVSTSLAEAMYLLDSERRDRIAILLDSGYITTTYSLIQGDGILFQDSFDFGGGYITAAISEKTEASFDDAETIKRKVSLTAASTGAYDVVSCDNGKYYGAETVREVIRNCLDVLCEKIEEAAEKSGYVIPDYVPIEITGGGISYIRGAKAHLSDRLGAYTEIVTPKVPLKEKPTESSVLSLLDLTF